MRLVYNLLPLLRQSLNPRVLSVLNGGREGPIAEDNLDLQGDWSILRVGNHTTTMTSLAFDHLAAENSNIAFLHAFPGIVKTDMISRLTAPESKSVGSVGRLAVATFRGISSVVLAAVGMNVQDCGDRQAYLLTNTNEFGPGAWRVNAASEKISAAGVLKGYRERSTAEQVWKHTLNVSSREPK
jgi:hypothetical protein